MDGWTGAVLYAKKADVPRSPASTVKVMTALVLLQRHVRLDRVVTVSPLAVAYRGSTAGLYIGERLTVWDLLHGMLLPSGNDAAIALSQILASTPDRFAGLMNAQAARMRLRHTHYMNPNGFDVPGQFTTARDLAIVTRAAMHSPAFALTVHTRVWTARSVGSATVHQWSNLNQLLWSHQAVDGVKTGTTPAAGACLVSSVHKGGKWVIAVNLGSTQQSRFHDGAVLLNYGLRLASGLPSTR